MQKQWILSTPPALSLTPPLVKDLRFLIQVEAIAWQNNSMGREKPQRPLAVLF